MKREFLSIKRVFRQLEGTTMARDIITVEGDDAGTWLVFFMVSGYALLSSAYPLKKKVTPMTESLGEY